MAALIQRTSCSCLHVPGTKEGEVEEKGAKNTSIKIRIPRKRTYENRAGERCIILCLGRKCDQYIIRTHFKEQQHEIYPSQVPLPHFKIQILTTTHFFYAMREEEKEKNLPVSIFLF